MDELDDVLDAYSKMTSAFLAAYREEGLVEWHQIRAREREVGRMSEEQIDRLKVAFEMGY